MPPIRVLQVVASMTRAGIETFIMNNYRNIDREKVQFDFLTHRNGDAHYNDEIHSLGGHIYTMPQPKISSVFTYLNALDNFFSEHPYGIVHGHLDSVAGLYLRAARKHGTAIRIAHSHSTKIDPGIKKIIVELLHKTINSVATHRLACSTEAAIWLYGKRQVSKGNVTILRNAIDLEAFRFNPHIRESVRKSLGLGNCTVYGHIGRFELVKNHRFLLQVYKQIHIIDPDSRLLLVGDGSNMQAVKEQTRALGLENNVLFLGVRSDIPDLLMAMDVFLFPSIFEGLPVVTVEAQATGLCCIINDSLSMDISATQLVRRISISEVSSWAEQAILCTKAGDRLDVITELRQKGYDIKDSVRTLLSIYGNP